MLVHHTWGHNSRKESLTAFAPQRSRWHKTCAQVSAASSPSAHHSEFPELQHPIHADPNHGPVGGAFVVDVGAGVSLQEQGGREEDIFFDIGKKFE